MFLILFLGLCLASAEARHYVIPRPDLQDKPFPFWRVPMLLDSESKKPPSQESTRSQTLAFTPPSWNPAQKVEFRRKLSKNLRAEALRLQWLQATSDSKGPLRSATEVLLQFQRTLKALEVPFTSSPAISVRSHVTRVRLDLPPWTNLFFVARRTAMEHQLAHQILRIQPINREHGDALNIRVATLAGKINVRLVKPEPNARVCILVDDVGYHGKGIRTYFKMNMPVTISVLPFYDTSPRFARQARELGFEVMLHMPMQSSFASYYKYENLIKVGLSKEDLVQRVHRVVKEVPFIQGINNHEGSKATSDSQTMETVMRQLADYGYYFIDSVTSQNSKAYSKARKHGLIAGRRTFDFLDNVKSIPAISKKIDQLIHHSLRRPDEIVVTILHEKSAPAVALRNKLPQFREKGIEILSPSDFLL